MEARATTAPRGARVLGAGLCGAAVVAVIAAYVAGLGDGFANSDEVIYAELVRAMHRSGDWLTLRYHDAIVLQRPAGPVTMVAAVSYLVDGELGLRLLPSLLTACAAIAAGAIVWRRFGSLGAGCFTMLVVAGTLSVHVYGRMLLSDPPFVLAVVGAFAATIAAQDDPRAFKWAAAGLGLAFAMKSLAAAIPAAGLAPWLIVAWRRHRRAGRGRELRVPVAALLFLALAAPFYVIGLAQHGGRFVREHFGYNLASRAAGELEGIGIGGPTAYVEHIARADGPAVAVLLLGGIAAAAAIAWRRRDATLGAAATAPIVTLLGLSLVGTRLPHYLLVFYPLAAVCTGAVLARLFRSANANATANAPRAPRPAPRSPLPWLEALALPAIGLLLLYVTASTPPFDATAYPSPETEAMAHVAAAETRPDEPVYSLDLYLPALGYYADRRWVLLSTSDRLTRIVGSIDLFRDARTVRPVPPLPRGRVVIVGAHDGLDRFDELRGARVLAKAGDLELRRAVIP